MAPSDQDKLQDQEPDTDAEVTELVQRLQVSQKNLPTVPRLFTSKPLLQDPLQTETSISQEDTVEECLPYLTGAESEDVDFGTHGLPKLKRQLHIDFLYESLEENPSSYVGYDPSRPWIIYWALTGLCLLGEDISSYRERVIQTLTAAQNLGGGFGGGHGQASHIAPSYAAVLSLAMVGGSDALDIVDRKAMWEWLGEIKQPDGGFSVTIGGEIDVRGAYCAMVVIAVLNLPLELPPNAPARQPGLSSFLDNLPDWLSSCQTYEGGVAAYPGNEAHGAYAFCVLACLCILGEPKQMIPKYLNLPSLLSWLSARQYAPEGSFSGRTNKLVDACYSHWVGGCWPLIYAALEGGEGLPANNTASTFALWCQEGLARYILSCAQAQGGGLRDKPSKMPDGYHSCYALTGLSSIQHRQYFNAKLPPGEHPLESAFRWESSRDSLDERKVGGSSLFDVEDLLEPIHPVFVIPFDAIDRARVWASGKIGF